MLKIVIFDFDGVIIDSINLIQDQFLKNHPSANPAVFKELNLGNFHEESKKISHLRRPMSEEEEAAELAKYATAKSMTPFYPGIPELLRDLHASGILLALNTSGYNNNCIPILEQAGVKAYFDFLGTAEVSKSKVEKFKMIEEKYALPKETVLFVTDTLGDLKEAAVADIPTVAATWGAHDASFFKTADYPNLRCVVNTVSELRDFIFMQASISQA
jgi:phosphoglycolate phosphatase